MKRIRLFLLVFALFVGVACLILSMLARGIRRDTFQNDQHGVIAQAFFPDADSLPPSATSEFEYRKTGLDLYEGYYLRLTFDSTAEYEAFLTRTEREYTDMTDEQCAVSFFIIHQARFTVEDFLFRAIDMTPFGGAEEVRYVGLVAHCDVAKEIVYLYFCYDLASIEPIEVGLGQNGYLPFYGDTWSVD